MQNVGKLAGKTVFITGASRGIGKAIALKCARDGANVVVVAKTATPHPKLPGTIYTVATEVEDLGGHSLPCVVDVRNESDVQAAINAAVEKFGGIDILVNNASAITLKSTVDVSMKAFDLMHSVNVRATFLCSKLCIPHLKKAKNPHILTLSPPLSMKPIWFKTNLAYTMAKYGMSQCVLGMAEEFRSDGIAVNALWPRTAIFTAAMEMLAGPSVKSQCRRPEIVADAAYAILLKDSRSFTGNFCLDEDVVKDAGVTDLDQYRYDSDDKLMIDFFLDDYQSPAQTEEKAADRVDIRDVFSQIQSMLGEAAVRKIGGVFTFKLTDGGEWYLDLKSGAGAVGEGAPPGDQSDCTLTLSEADLVKLLGGKLDTTAAFMSGKLNIGGDMQLAMKLATFMNRGRSKL